MPKYVSFLFFTEQCDYQQKRIKGRCCLDNGVVFHVALTRSVGGVMQEAHESYRWFCALVCLCVCMSNKVPQMSKPMLQQRQTRYLTHQFAKSIVSSSDLCLCIILRVRLSYKQSSSN